jgi:broad specificity phosphatase PhoE
VRILLVRHGRSGHAVSGLLDLAAYQRWREAYEAAGIDANEKPPAELIEAARDARALVASTAARAIASAKLLAPDREVVISPLLRELELPPPRLRVRLPLIGWVLLIGAKAAFRGIPEEFERGRAAAEWLSEMAAERGPIVALTHGSVRRLIATELLALGWSAAKGRRGFHHWSAWAFTR